MKYVAASEQEQSETDTRATCTAVEHGNPSYSFGSTALQAAFPCISLVFCTQNLVGYPLFPTVD